MSSTETIALTEDQALRVASMLRRMEPGGACFAQVYPDGMRVRIFDAETAKRVQDAAGIIEGDVMAYTAAQAEAHE